LLPTAVVGRIERAMTRGRLLPLVLAAAWTLTLLAASAPGAPLTERFRHRARAATPLGQMESWVRHHTPVDAVFLIPPSVSSFRSSARRAIVVNHKAFPFRDPDMMEWFSRIQDVAPLSVPSRAPPGMPALLDGAFAHLTAADLAIVCEKYGASFVLRSAPLPEPDPRFRLEHVVNGWTLYRLDAGESVHED
jgi:hypothetical protein